MVVVTLGIAAVALGGGVYYFKKSKLKEGDKDIERERKRERKLEYEMGASLPTDLNHYLHQHLLFLGYGGISRCDLCLKTIEDNSHRYNCSENCNFNLHKACALSDNMLINLKENTSLQTSAHEHQLSMVTATSESTCKHCKNKCRHKYRYYCSHCDKKFHLFCAMHPTRLLSFLHPEHELELKTRPTLQKCAVCHHKGDLNARVYCCEKCKFYVHPGCALKIQIRQHPFHDDHLLVFREVKSTAVCGYCRLKCKYWSYSCSFCNVNFHEECLEYSTDNESKNVDFKNKLKRGFKEGIKEEFKEDMENESPMEILGDVIDFIQCLLT